MTTLAEHNLLPQLPQWVRFGDPADAHPAAFGAWVHTPSGCLLLKLWLQDPFIAECGAWVFTVSHPDGRRRDAWVAAVKEPADEAAVLESAAAVVRELTESIDQARP